MDQQSTTIAAAATGPRRTRRRWLIAVGAILVVLVAVVVIWRLAGGGDLQRIAGAADATLAAGSARVAVVATVEGVPILGPFTLTVAQGELDLAEQQAHLRREVPDVSRIPVLNQLLPEAVEILHDGTQAYLRLPVGGEQAWVRLGETVEDSDGPAIAAPGLTNPAAALALLRVLDGVPEVLGEEVIRGQESTRFRVVVDLERAAEVLSGRAEDVAKGLRRLRGRNDLPMLVWLDGDDRVTRLRYAVRPELAGQSVTVITDLELFDFGAPVDIRAPSADELVTLPADRLRAVDPFTWLRELLGL